jgi:hypothetical protein
MNNKITFKLLLSMMIFFILPAYSMYDYGIVFPILWLIIGAIVFKCNITNYDEKDIDNSLKFVNSSGNDIDNKELPTCIIRFFTYISNNDIALFLVGSSGMIFSLTGMYYIIKDLFF